ncbi:MAG: UDP-2,4-diacetamido-2,4,6-trideoxy-beta-L-altropyranose hydrolase [Rhodopseudomonas sp.]|nr:UDP-2,4-diacetamido-2,4,6-trideoxy-beta-L-altropyranose hydrolase [Rhodopseudomonas sp.]
MLSAAPHVLFRTDATAEIGAGHLMRCLGLAQYLRDNGVEVSLATVAPGHRFVDLWRDEGAIVHDLTGVARGSEADANLTLGLSEKGLVVVDGYDFGARFVEALRRVVSAVAVFDDLNDRPVDADVVINQNAGAETNFKYDLTNGVALLGCQYVILRRTIRTAQHRGQGGILVTLGGADRDNLGLGVLERLAIAKIDTPVHLICTAGDEGLRKAQEFCAANRRFSVSGPGEILDFLCRADVALCAGGTTSLELAFLGVPASIVVLAENQRPGAIAVARAGAAMIADTIEAAVANISILAETAVHRRMSAAGRSLVDGKGVERVAAALLPAHFSETVH